MENERKFLDVVFNLKLVWNRVSNLPCVHTFHDDKYYINLLKYNVDQTPYISLSVNNIELNERNILTKDYPFDNQNYIGLDQIYNNALADGVKIEAERDLIIA